MSLTDLNHSLRDLTVVILSHKRQHCLEKTLLFWNDFHIKTLVVDESDRPLQNLERFPITEYHHVKKPFNTRCLIAAKRLKSKYAMVVSDDEVFLPSALGLMSKTLEADRNLLSVGGMAIAIWKYGPRVAGSWPYKSTFGYENMGNSALERITRHTNQGNIPITSFFTSNMVRTEYLEECLKLFGKAPTIATEAISTLILCGSGKSKYLPILYWIRNWNQFPQSHTGWDRSKFIHDWWNENRGKDIWNEFNFDLKTTFEKLMGDSSFEECWNLILSSSRASEPVTSIGTQGSDQLRAFRNHLYYYAKSLLNRNALPELFSVVLNDMRKNGVKVDFSETFSAIEIVSKLKPYKHWK